MKYTVKIAEMYGEVRQMKFKFSNADDAMSFANSARMSYAGYTDVEISVIFENEGDED